MIGQLLALRAEQAQTFLPRRISMPYFRLAMLADHCPGCWHLMYWDDQSCTGESENELLQHAAVSCNTIVAWFTCAILLSYLRRSRKTVEGLRQ